MLKSELIAQLLAENPHLPQRDAETAVGVILESIIATLQTGGRVELRGFGVFTVRSSEPGPSRNPKTGETILLKARRRPHFKAGKSFHDRINRATPQIGND